MYLAPYTHTIHCDNRQTMSMSMPVMNYIAFNRKASKSPMQHEQAALCVYTFIDEPVGR